MLSLARTWTKLQPTVLSASSRRPFAWVRRQFRSSEIWFIGLAIVVGAAAGLLAVVQAGLAHSLQARLYGFSLDDRLSALPEIAPITVLWLPAGGAALSALTWITLKWRGKRLMDVVEANALYGGILSLRDSLAICLQTLVSNGCGGSVGLEAAYAQAGGAVASQFGQRLKLRRTDLRTLVGAGAGAAIGAAFGAPLAGAFYAFEVVIGSYAPVMIAPVAAACLTSVLVARMLGSAPYSIEIQAATPPDAIGYLLYSVLGVICAGVGIVLMRLVALAERGVQATGLPTPLRPIVGGFLLAGLALVSPQVLSSGHGALHADLAVQLGIGALGLIFLLKACASVTALAFGFRGGLFFAALFLGSLLGQVFAQLTVMTGAPLGLERENAALVGMGALAVAVVGGPLTMSFLVLETTGDFGIAAATLAASLVASTIVRERFGYSLSTWRMHLRGETIRSARDVGWVRTLTAGRLMRTNVATLADREPVSVFRRQYPLGSQSGAVLIDDAQRYAGIVFATAAFQDDVDPTQPLRLLAVNSDVWLTPEMNIQQVMAAFQAAETDELAVVGPDGGVLGMVSELYVTRRYAKELDHVQQSMFG